jgi:hypothetical protein
MPIRGGFFKAFGDRNSCKRQCIPRKKWDHTAQAFQPHRVIPWQVAPQQSLPPLHSDKLKIATLFKLYQT